jgi:hypothetical protein
LPSCSKPSLNALRCAEGDGGVGRKPPRRC